MKQYFLFISLAVGKFCLAQSDTSSLYLTKAGPTTNRDSAVTVVKFTRTGSTWHGKEFYLKNNQLKSEGDYADNSVKTPLGEFKNYTEQGKLDFAATYADGKPKEVTYYYKNGAKKSSASFDEKGIKQQKGWDEEGKEIRNYIVSRQASFKGGSEGWNKYLQKNMNRNVAIEANAPAGQYTVELSFSILADGYPGKVKALSIPPECKPCASEAINVVRNSKEWQPAILNNEAVEFFTGQKFVFEVPAKGKGK